VCYSHAVYTKLIYLYTYLLYGIIIIMTIIMTTTMMMINESAVELLTNFGHRIALVSSDDKKGQLLLFLFQRLSIDLQRFNAIVAA